ncbi:hypothetical protein ALO96_200142 [Pseudomonas savastanoi pv. glycinea]|nr:hypothetical protein ALO96_200142 [Pseudomonas savastanoi pv. glycinea]
MNMRLSELSGERMKIHRTLSGDDKVITTMPMTCKLLNPLRRLTWNISATKVLNLVTEDNRTLW